MLPLLSLACLPANGPVRPLEAAVADDDAAVVVDLEPSFIDL